MSYMEETTKKARVPCQERRAEISLRLKIMTTWDANQTEWANEFNVSRQQIAKDIKICLSEVHREDLLEITHNLKRTLAEAVLVARRLLRSSDDNIRAKGVHAAVEASLAYLRMTTLIGDDVATGKPTVEQINDFYEKRFKRKKTDSTENVGVPPPKPDVTQFIAFLDGPYKKIKEERMKDNTDKIQVDYDNLKWSTQNPIKATDGASPRPQESIPEQEPDDLIPYNPNEDDEEEENHA